MAVSNFCFCRSVSPKRLFHCLTILSVMMIVGTWNVYYSTSILFLSEAWKHKSSTIGLREDRVFIESLVGPRSTSLSSQLSIISKFQQCVNGLSNDSESFVHILERQWPHGDLRNFRLYIEHEVNMSTYDNIMLTKANTKQGRLLPIHRPAHRHTIRSKLTSSCLKACTELDSSRRKVNTAISGVKISTGKLTRKLNTTNSAAKSSITDVKRTATFMVSKTMARALPKKSLLPKPPYKVCSLVGNGGILQGSHCGVDIDKADMVFRFNLAPTVGFEKDVGSKSNMTTMNPSIVTTKYERLKTAENVTKFAQVLNHQRGLIWLPAYAIKNPRFILKTFRKFQNKNSHVRFVLSDTTHFNAIQNMWQTIGFTRDRMSTGFYFISSALSMCDKIHLYGFWPFRKAPDGSGRMLSYHYYENMDYVEDHDWLKEGKYITAMHRMGLLNVHVRNCTI